MGGAQAADLPVKAKAVEYVKICSLYGAGFYYIPGTDTCIKLGGYLRAEVALNTNTIFNGNTSAALAVLRTADATTTSLALVKTSTSTRAPRPNTAWFVPSSTWCSPGRRIATRQRHRQRLHRLLAARQHGRSGVGPNNANAGAIAGGTLGVYYAFIQFAGFTMGKAVVAVRRSLDQLSRQQLRRSRWRRRHGHWCEPVHLHC